MVADGNISVSRRKDGVFTCRLYLGTDPVTGRAIRPSKSFPHAKTEAEALLMARAWASEVNTVGALGPNATLGSLLDVYVSGMETRRAPENTTRTYRNFIDYLGHLAKVPASTITTPMIDRLYAILLGRGLGGRTVAAFHAFLSGAFKWMAGHGAVTTNPVKDATKPSWSGAECDGFTEEQAPQVLSLLVSAMADKYRLRRVVGIAGICSFYGGLRVGEACALRWGDAKRSKGVIHIRGTIVEGRGGKVERQPYPKGKKAGSLGMPDEFWDHLSEWRRLQRMRGVDALRQGSPICTSTGGWVRPNDVSKGFSSLLRGAGMEGNYHMLRHTMASIMLANYEDPDLVRKRLREADITTLYRNYSHVMPSHDQAAAKRFAAIVSGADGDWDDDE